MTTKLDTRDRLIESARLLFLEKGYTATGVAEILKRAELNAGSLYHFFPTKEDLLLAVLARYQEMLGPRVLDPVFKRIADPIERVFGILNGYRRLLLETQLEQGCPIGNLALELSTSTPAARRLIAANFVGWRKAVADCLRQAAGRLPSNLDHDQLALLVLTVMEGAVMLARAERSIEPFDLAVTQLRDYFDRLLDDGGNWSTKRRPARVRPSARPTVRKSRPKRR